MAVDTGIPPQSPPQWVVSGPHRPIRTVNRRKTKKQTDKNKNKQSGKKTPELMNRKAVPPSHPHLYHDEIDRTEEALNTFHLLERCQYLGRDLGNSLNDFMECDCNENLSHPVEDDDEEEDSASVQNIACGEDSDCINRLTLIECVDALCESTCGKNCQNQRFQKRQYAPVKIFKTEMKGFGVLADADLESNQFIYEYIGEVIDEEEFRDRLIDYDEQHLKHFYFMMLQNGEFIDATKKGALARFINHSCNPNAYVNKWVVNGKLKMGIFSKRKILKGEEITFDYNVDRYGATAQKCYCGEPNCIGFLGGKRQSDSASLLPQNYAIALGVNPTIEKKWIKEMKNLGKPIIKNKNNTFGNEMDSNYDNINIEFIESLEMETCEDQDDIKDVIPVLLQVKSKIVAQKLLERLYPVDKTSLLNLIIKLHGYKCFANLLDLFMDDIVTLADILDFLLTFPKTTKNGIVASKLENKIESIKKKFPKLKSRCDELLDKWKDFEIYTRITKKILPTGPAATLQNNNHNNNNSNNNETSMRRNRLPIGWEIIHENGKFIYFNTETREKLNHPPQQNENNNMVKKETKNNNSFYDRSYMRKESSEFSNSPRHGSDRSISQIFTNTYLGPSKTWYRDDDSGNNSSSNKRSRQQSEELQIEKAKEEETKRLKLKMEEEEANRLELDKIIEEANKQREREIKQREESERIREQEKLKYRNISQTARLEHKWMKFFAVVVPNMVKKYHSPITLSHEHIKECSKDIVQKLSKKEMSKDSNGSVPSQMTKEKNIKIRKFVKSYMEKFIEKYKRKHHI